MTVQITPTLLQAATGCPAEAAETFAPHLAAACAHYQIDTPERLVEFLAQLAHESGGLRYVREVADGSAYDGRADLGNIEPGDGRRFRGRGLIQVTGRSNYGRMSVLLAGRGAPDFTAEPEALETAEWAAWSAAAYWADASLNDLADAGMTVKIGRRINRGNANSQREANGEADRLRRREIAARAIVAAIEQIDAGSPIEPEPMPPQPDQPRDAPGAPFPFPDSNRPGPFPRAGEADPVVEDPSHRTEVHPMGPFVIPAIVELAKAIPKLGGMFATSEVAQRNVKAAEVVLGAVLPAVGAANAQEAAERVRADPVALQAATKAVESVWYQVSEAGSGGIGGAFERDLKAQTSGEPLWRSPSFVIACLLLPLAYFIAGNVSGLYGAEWTAEARAALLSSVATGIVMGLLGYYFGQTTTRNRTPS